jgi:hypothetical protein
MNISECVGVEEDMLVSECVVVLESEVCRLKARERELMRRCGELLERARLAEKLNTMTPDPAFTRFVCAAEDYVQQVDWNEQNHHDIGEALQEVMSAWANAKHSPQLRAFRSWYAEQQKIPF